MTEGPTAAARTVTRDDLIEALTLIQVTPVAGKVPAEWMADAILAGLDEVAAARRAGDAEAWGGQEPSSSYAEWVAEGREDGDA